MRQTAASVPRAWDGVWGAAPETLGAELNSQFSRFFYPVLFQPETEGTLGAGAFEEEYFFTQGWLTKVRCKEDHSRFQHARASRRPTVVKPSTEEGRSGEQAMKQTQTLITKLLPDQDSPSFLPLLPLGLSLFFFHFLIFFLDYR